MPNIKQSVYEFVVEQLGFCGVSTTNITPNSKLENDLGVDSLDQVEMVMSAEEQFDIEISDEDTENVVTVQEAVNLINAKVSAK